MMGGAYFEVFSPQQKEGTSQWKVTGVAKKTYDKEVKSYVYTLEGAPATTKMQLPKDPRQTLQLVQRYLIVQLALKKGLDFSMELGFADLGQSKRRVFFSTAQKDVQITPLHAKIPLKIVKIGEWLNLCFDMVSLVGETWRGQTFKALESISISANCRLRKIFTMKVQPPDTVGDDELYGCQSSNAGELDQIPKQCQFAIEVQHFTQLLTIDKIKHAERLRGGGDVRGSLNSALDWDLNTSGRKSAAANNDSFHIAFGSKIPGVPTTMSAGRKSAKEGSGHLTNRSTRTISRAEDGVASSAYHDMSVSISSRDGMYTGRDPGGGGGATSREKNIRVPNPPDQVRPSGYRKGHQRQFSDPASMIDGDNSSKQFHEMPMVQPHPPREPSHDRVRPRPRVKNGSAGKNRLSSAGSAKDEGIGTSISSAAANTPSNPHNQYYDGARPRIVSDGELHNTSTSSNESGPRQRSADQVHRGQARDGLGKIESKSTGRPQFHRKEYRRENYEPVGADNNVDDSVSDVIAILKEQTIANRRFSLSSGDEEEDDPNLEYMESEGEEEEDKDTYLFVSQPKPAPRQKNVSPNPSQQLVKAGDKVVNTPPKGNKSRLKEKKRGPRPEEDFIHDSSSDDEKNRLLTARQGSRPSSGSRPNSGNRPSSGSRPNSGSRTGNQARVSSGSRTQRNNTHQMHNGVSPKNPNSIHSRTKSGSETESKTLGATDARTVPNGGIGDINVNNMEQLTLPPFVGGSPTFNGGVTDRSCVSRIGKKSLREVSFSDAELEPATNEKPYDFSKYIMEELSASDEERMLASIQGARDSAEYEPVNLIAPPKDHPLPQKKPSWPLPHSDGPLKQIHDDSPSVTSDDDTSLSTWKPPPLKSHNYQREKMKARISSDTLTSSNPREYSGVCSPPVLHGITASSSLDDVSTLSNISPRKPHSGGSPRTTDTEDEELDLLYDQQLNCYYDPKTCKYYELS